MFRVAAPSRAGPLGEAGKGAAVLVSPEAKTAYLFASDVEETRDLEEPRGQVAPGGCARAAGTCRAPIRGRDSGRRAAPPSAARRAARCRPASGPRRARRP